MSSPPRQTSCKAKASKRLGKPLDYHGPGWIVETPHYEVICWAPGEVHHQGKPTGTNRDEWLLSVDRDWFQPNEDLHGVWLSGGFTSGKSLIEVLPVLALLDDEDRYCITAVLIQQLGMEQ